MCCVLLLLATEPLNFFVLIANTIYYCWLILMCFAIDIARIMLEA